MNVKMATAVLEGLYAQLAGLHTHADTCPEKKRTADPNTNQQTQKLFEVVRACQVEAVAAPALAKMFLKKGCFPCIVK